MCYFLYHLGMGPARLTIDEGKIHVVPNKFLNHTFMWGLVLCEWSQHEFVVEKCVETLRGSTRSLNNYFSSKVRHATGCKYVA